MRLVFNIKQIARHSIKYATSGALNQMLCLFCVTLEIIITHDEFLNVTLPSVLFQ